MSSKNILGIKLFNNNVNTFNIHDLQGFVLAFFDYNSIRSLNCFHYELTFYSINF